ncbi:hypothetical protein DPMN_106288 [Dreissena polymorpha]|uniref:Uncharacterized protein n=1 Tax=Dreissena polymorpha TaxID=45954 RepID=A0A9D4K4P3_DREPO|nr:hypothetical protein DPMN_106288 [Dreissena polymorpha]
MSCAAVYGGSYKLSNTKKKHIGKISRLLLCFGPISVCASVRHRTCTTAYCLHSTVITSIFKILNRGWCTRFSTRRHKSKPSFRKHVSLVDGHPTGKVGFPPDIQAAPKPTTQDIKLEIAAILQNSSNRGDPESRRM